MAKNNLTLPKINTAKSHDIKRAPKKPRAYVCHTYYHVYVTLLKELSGKESFNGTKADILLSKMSGWLTDKSLFESLVSCGVFADVKYLDERRFEEFPELIKYKNPDADIVKKMFNRISFCKDFPKLMEPYIDIDFTVYKDIYVYCDEDPIAYYLSYKKIYFHSLEDGLDNMKFNSIFHADHRFWGLKIFLARLGFIYIASGYSKYSLDMEVNNISVASHPGKNWIEAPREAMIKKLSPADKNIIFRVFVKDADELIRLCADGKKAVLILSQPLCPLDVRKNLFEDIINEYCEGLPVVIKPHPRDTLDYKKEFPSAIVLDGLFPIEVLNFYESIHFKKVISVITTAIDAIHFADEKINLGPEFLDKYEDPSLHDFS